MYIIGICRKIQFTSRFIMIDYEINRALEALNDMYLQGLKEIYQRDISQKNFLKNYGKIMVLGSNYDMIDKRL